MIGIAIDDEGGDVEIRQLITFEKVADLQSFSKAAAMLNYSQSAVTIQVQQLEEEFDTKFFDRIGRNITLTPAGKVFLKRAREILHEVQKTYSAINNDSPHQHILHIGCIDSLCSCHLSEFLKDLFILHPKYQVKITTSSPEKLVHMMSQNQVDLIYVLDQPIYDVRWVKPVEVTEPLVFVSSVDSPLTKLGKLSLEEVLEEPFLLTESNANYRYALDQYLASRGLKVDARLELANTDVLLNLVKEGYGLSFLPYFAVRKKVIQGEIAILPVPDYDITMSRQLIYHRDKWMTEEMKEFVRIAKTMIF